MKTTRTQIAEWLKAAHSEADEPQSFEQEAETLARVLTAQAVARIEAEMQRQKKSAAAVAECMGESRQRVSKILKERGNITLRTLAKFAVALDTRVGVQFGEEAGAASLVQAPTRYIVIHHMAQETEQLSPFDMAESKTAKYDSGPLQTAEVCSFDESGVA